MTNTKTDKKPVLVLDKHGGVYFGYLTDANEENQTVKVERGRHCFYWPVGEPGELGVFGLASAGPGPGAKVGPRVTMTIFDVAKIVDVEDRAVERWECASWN